MSLLGRGSRACGNCAAAKARCSGDACCTRCSSRNLCCSYLTADPNDFLPPQLDPTSQVEGHLVPNQTPSFGNEVPLMSWDLNMNVTNNWLNAISDDCFDFFTSAQPSSGATWPDGSMTVSGDLTTTLSSIPLSTQPGDTIQDTSNANLPGEYYADGQASRLPHVKRRRKTSMSCTTDSTAPYGWSTDPVQLQTLRGSKYPSRISDAHYSELSGLCRRLRSSPDTAIPSTLVDTPSRQQMDSLLDCYWKHFDSTFPFIRPSLRVSTTSVYLTLAMCAVGNHYTGASSEHVVSLSETLKSALSIAKGSEDEALEFKQAQLLYCYCSMYGSHTIDSARTATLCAMLRNLFDELVKEHKTLEREYVAEEAIVDEDRHARWLYLEQLRRCAYAAWTLDSIHAAQYHEVPTFSLKDADLPLPAKEDLWNAVNAQQWQAVYHPLVSEPPLQEALQDLYINRGHPKCRSEFARVIVVYGIHQRMREVSEYFMNPLSSWDPTMRGSRTFIDKTVWLPSVSAFAAWQNSTCDALDVLHWQANATVGYANGFEHPTVLHLHFSRVALLAPCSNLVRLARSVAGGRNVEYAFADPDAQLVRRWAVQHQCKARLAAIHAGVLLWHVRWVSKFALSSITDRTC